VPRREREQVARDLKPIYTALDADAAQAALEAFDDKWGDRFPVITQAWLNAWEYVTPFLAFPDEVRRVIYTTDENVKGADGAVVGDFRRWMGRAECSQGLRAAPVVSIRERLRVFGRARFSSADTGAAAPAVGGPQRALGLLVGAGDPGPKSGASGMEAPPRRIAA
jgi:Transposase, Mutator family